MLDANSGLGWRDVQNILATSADYAGPEISLSPPNTIWEINGAENWNGGGMHISPNHGFGEVNAYAAVRMAEVWTLFSSAKASANEELVTSGVLAPQLVLPSIATVTYQFTITDHLDMEHVDLLLWNSTPRFYEHLIHADFAFRNEHSGAPHGFRKPRQRCKWLDLDVRN